MLSWQDAAVLTGVLAAAAVILRLSSPRWARTTAAFAIEATVIAALYTIWQLAGTIAIMGTQDAYHRASWIASTERTLHLPSEAGVQHLVLGHSTAVQALNLYYASMHFAMLGVFLVWLFIRHREAYSRVRNTIALATLACLAISFVPVAPPRLLGNGIVDTAVEYGQSVYNAGLATDQMSAMPSVHVLWCVAIGWYAVRIGRSRWRWLGPLHAAITIFVVVATGNHWWSDGIVAIAVLVVCAWLRVGLAYGFRALTDRYRPALPAWARAAPVPVSAASPTAWQFDGDDRASEDSSTPIASNPAP